MDIKIMSVKIENMVQRRLKVKQVPCAWPEGCEEIVETTGFSNRVYCERHRREGLRASQQRKLDRLKEKQYEQEKLKNVPPATTWFAKEKMEKIMVGLSSGRTHSSPCENCIFEDECRELVMAKSQDMPFCFATSTQYERFMKFYGDLRKCRTTKDTGERKYED